MFSLLNWLQGDLKLYEGFYSSKISFIISGAILFLTLYMSVTRTCKFFWGTELPDQEVKKSSLFW